MASSIIVGIAGGSGSGKTTLAARLREQLGPQRAAIVYQDSYYFDQSQSFDHDGGAVNFDHPDSLDFALLATHLRELKAGHSVQIPIYDFKTHSRLKNSETLCPHALVLVDGILILSQPAVVKELDLAIFVDTPEAVRFDRRLHRDVSERGRTPEGVRRQFARQVKPMHDRFVESSKGRAQLVLSGLENVDSLVAQAMSRLQPLLQGAEPAH